MPRRSRAPVRGLSFPNALNTGPAAAGYNSLTPESASIPATGPYPGYVQVLGDGSLLVEGCSFAATLSCDATNIRFRGCQFTPAATFYCVQPGPDAAGPWVFEYCVAGAVDSTVANNVFYGFPTPDGPSPSVRSVIRACDLRWFSAQPVIAQNNILITGNYIHDIVEVPGNHSEALYLGLAGGGGSSDSVTVTGNTLLPGPTTNNTAALFMDAHGNAYSNYLISGNLLGGGSYAAYLGVANGGTDTNLVVSGNYFTTAYYTTSGSFGYATDAPTWGSSGNTWSGNTWFDGASAGSTLAAP